MKRRQREEEKHSPAKAEDTGMESVEDKGEI